MPVGSLILQTLKVKNGGEHLKKACEQLLQELRKPARTKAALYISP